jgi:hypothetical protein
LLHYVYYAATSKQFYLIYFLPKKLEMLLAPCTGLPSVLSPAFFWEIERGDKVKRETKGGNVSFIV